MSHDVTRLYATSEAAHAAVEELREDGFTDIHVIAPPGEGVPVSAIAAQIAEAHVPLEKARALAPAVAAGQILVTVQAPFGRGKLATNILRTHGPVAASALDGGPHQPLYDEAAPLSSALGLPLLIDDPAPLSNALGLPTLAREEEGYKGTLGLPLLIRGDYPDGRWGFKFLSDDPTPLSTMLGIPVLCRCGEK